MGVGQFGFHALLHAVIVIIKIAPDPSANLQIKEFVWDIRVL